MVGKVLFVHDGPILCNKDESVFYGVHYNDEIVERYAFFGTTVSFLMRGQFIDDSDAGRYSKITHPAFNFIRVPNFKSIKSYFKKAEAARIIKKAVESHDVIILRMPSAIGTIAFKHAKSLNKPVLMEMVACPYDALWNYDWRGRLIAKSKMRLYQDILKQASHVVYVTSKFLQSRYPTQNKSISCSNVVLNSLDLSVLPKRLEKIDSKKAGDPIVICTVAAVDVVYKGHQHVIEAIALLKKEGFIVNYKIVGQGNPERLKNLIAQHGLENEVELVGSLTHNKVFAYLDNVDVYIQPSETEGLPRAVVEALSRACPAYGSDTGGIPELLNPDVLFKVGSVNEIKALLKESGDKEKLKRYAAENIKTAENYQLDILNNRRRAFYEEFKKDYNL